MGWALERGKTLPELGESLGLNWKDVMGKAMAFRETLIQGKADTDISHIDGASVEITEVTEVM